MTRPAGPGTFCVLLLLFLVLCGRQSHSRDCRPFFGAIVNGGFAVADRKGDILAACNAKNAYVPASIIKIATALAAFEILGPGYRFTTEFHFDGEENLYIRGTGDPFLISEEIALVADRLSSFGLVRVNNVYIDNSNYSLEGRTPGQGHSDNPYDVPLAATAVNFNTVAIRVDKQGKVESAEEQTPYLPIMAEMGRFMSPGTYRLNICRDGCEPDERTARAVAELFSAMLLKRGISITGSHSLRAVPTGARLLYRHENSRTLETVVSSFLEFSNNFVANQVFLACGVKTYGYPANMDKAKKAVGEALERIFGGETGGQLTMLEGAGLSRRNKVTGEVMIRVLHAFSPYSHLLKEREGFSLKSGTLDGVYNYAGYLANGNPFVILLNQQDNSRDKVLHELQGAYGSEAAGAP